MISPKMAKVNVRVARMRVLLTRTELAERGTMGMHVRVRAKRELAACERRQRHLRRLEGVRR